MQPFFKNNAGKGWWGIGMLCLLGFALRCYFATEKSISFDEWITYATSLGVIHPESSALFNPKTVVSAAYFQQALQHLSTLAPWSLGNILKALENDFNLPAYFVMMSGWLRLGMPFSAFMLRLPSLLMNIACIPMLVLLGRQFNHARAGWMAAGLFALMPYPIACGTDARPYSLILFLSLTGSLALLRLLKSHSSYRPWQWMWLMACIWLGLLTHYFFGLTALFWTVLLIRQRKSLQALWSWLSLAWGPPLLLTGLLFQQQWANMGSMNPLKATLSLQSVGGYLFKGLFTVFFLYSPWTDMVTLGLSGLLGLAVLFGIYRIWADRQSVFKTPWFQFWGWWLVIHGLGLLGISLLFQSRLLDVPRYWVFLLPPLFWLVGAWLTVGTSKARLLKCSAWLLPLLLIGTRFYKEQGYADFNYRQVSQAIQAQSEAKGVVLTVTGFPTAAALAYYLPAHTLMATQFTPPDPKDPQGANARLAALTENAPQVWFCASFNQFPQRVYIKLLDALEHQQGLVEAQSLITQPQPLVLVLLARPH